MLRWTKSSAHLSASHYRSTQTKVEARSSCAGSLITYARFGIAASTVSDYILSSIVGKGDV